MNGITANAAVSKRKRKKTNRARVPAILLLVGKTKDEGMVEGEKSEMTVSGSVLPLNNSLAWFISRLLWRSVASCRPTRIDVLCGQREGGGGGGLRSAQNAPRSGYTQAIIRRHKRWGVAAA